MNGKSEVWAKRLSNGNYAVLLLNRDAKASSDITLHWSDLKLKGTKKVRDVYQLKDVGTFKDQITKNIPPHSGLFLIIK